MRTSPSASHPTATRPSSRWRRAIAALTTAALAAGTIAATTATSDGLATNRPNATLSNLGINVVLAPGMQPTVVADGWAVLFAVDEAADGRDRNGDGDSTDLVLHVLELGSGSLAFDNVRNLGLALKPDSMFVTGDEATAFFVDEAAQGADLNGDGDTDDHVLHTWDERAFEVAASGLAVAADRLPEPARPIGTATFTAVVPEGAQGADLNGDGDLDDDVLHVWEPSRARVTSTGRAYATYGLYGASGLPGYALLADGQLAFMVDEAADGRDANGDGDAADDVVHVVESATATVRSLGLAAQGLHDGGPGLLVIEADEAATGRDLDGDGTVDGHPVLVSDGTAVGTAATGVQALPNYDVMADRVAPAGPGVVALVPFADGGGGNELLRYAVADGTLTDTGARTTRLVPAADGHVAFLSRSFDPVLHVLGPDGSVLATGIAGHEMRQLTDSLVAVDLYDRFWNPARLAAVVDVTTGEHWVPDLHLESWRAMALTDGRIGLRAVEQADGPFHAMLDGDDLDDGVLPALWDPVAGHTRTLDVGAVASWPTGDGDAVVAVDEATTGDLDGDGDATSTVLVRARFGPLGDPSGPVLDVHAQEVAPGEMQLDVVASSADATPLVALGATLEGASRDALTPTDGVYDAADETFSRTYAASEGQTVCVDALDADGHRSTTCATVDAVPDDTPPVVRDLTATPSVVHPGDDLRVEAIIDDSDTGGSAIAGATVQFVGGSTAMAPTEPPSDSAAEPYAATVTAPGTYGDHQLCVVGTDDEGNTAAPTCLTIEVRDLRGPAVTALGAAPDPVEEGEPLVLRATFDDRETGGSAIADAILSVDGTVLDTRARDGAMDSAVEEVEAYIDHATGVGDHQLCATASDTAGASTPETCTTFTVAAGEGPLVRNVAVQPPTVGLGRSVTLAAVVDDTETGGAAIAGANYTIDGRLSGQLGTDDFDEPIESVSADLAGFSTPGTRDLCVTGYDRNGNASAEPGCVTLTVVDDVAPVISALEVPDTVQVGAPFEVSATADDTAGGGSAIAQVEAVLDGLHAVSMAAADGSFDQAAEAATATLPGLDGPDTHEVCVRATDAAGNVTGATCATVIVVDTLAPTVSDLVLPTEPVVAGEPFTFTFTADDTATGGSAITTARATVAGGPGTVTTAPVDGALDGPREQMQGTVAGTQHPGILQVCVHATDAHGNQAEPLCDVITVVGRSVAGSGSIPSSVSALSEDAVFDLDVRETADGLQGSFTYVDGAYSFVATTITELRTDDSAVGHVSGRGTLFGLLTCDFSLTAHEGAYNGPEPGGLAVVVSACGPVPGAVYDSGPVQGLTSGAITVRGG